MADPSALAWALDEALTGLYLAAQPIVRSRDGALYGHELLLRTTSPRLPDPGAVLEAAERLGRVRDVGRVVRRLAAAVTIPAGTCLFVNVHSLELEDDELHSADTPLAGAARHVVLEITERGRIDAVSDLTARIARLRALGYRIAVDDFGAGYAALNSFASLRPDVAKIDMALVRGVDRDPLPPHARGLGRRHVPRPRHPGRRRGYRDRGRARDARRARLRPAAGLPDRHADGGTAEDSKLRPTPVLRSEAEARAELHLPRPAEARGRRREQRLAGGHGRRRRACRRR